MGASLAQGALVCPKGRRFGLKGAGLALGVLVWPEGHRLVLGAPHRP